MLTLLFLTGGFTPSVEVQYPVSVRDRSAPRYTVTDASAPRYRVVDRSGPRYTVEG